MFKKIFKSHNEREKKNNVIIITFSFNVKRFKELTRYFNKIMKKEFT